MHFCFGKPFDLYWIAIWCFKCSYKYIAHTYAGNRTKSDGYSLIQEINTLADVKCVQWRQIKIYLLPSFSLLNKFLLLLHFYMWSVHICLLCVSFQDKRRTCAYGTHIRQLLRLGSDSTWASHWITISYAASLWPLTLLWGEAQEAPVTKWDLRKCFHYRHWRLHDNYQIVCTVWLISHHTTYYWLYWLN